MNPPADDRQTMPPAARSAADVATAARFLDLLRAGRDARPAKVRRVRRSVRTHTYENDLKLTVAVDRVAEDMGDGNAE